MNIVLLNNVSDYYGKNGVPYSYTYDRLYNRKFDSKKINELYGINNQILYTKTEEALQKCMGEFLNNPSFRTISWLHEAAMDKVTGDRTKLMYINGIKNKIIYAIIRYGIFSLKDFYPVAGLVKRCKLKFGK